MTKFITEIFKEINDDISCVVKYKDNAALKILMSYAFDPSKKFILPDGDVPDWKRDAAPQGMNPSNLYMEARKLYVFCRPDLKALRRESIFLQLLENLHPSESELIIAIKDQKVSRLYPNITHEVALAGGFITPEISHRCYLNSVLVTDTLGSNKDTSETTKIDDSKPDLIKEVKKGGRPKKVKVVETGTKA